MSAPNPFLDAVRAVPHRDDCWAEGSYCEADGTSGYLYCNCDRDERIARGIKAAIVKAMMEREWPTTTWGHIMAAFIEAAK